MGNQRGLAWATVSLLLLSATTAQAQYEPLPDGMTVDDLLRELGIVDLLDVLEPGFYDSLGIDEYTWDDLPDGYDLDDFLTDQGIRDGLYAANLGIVYDSIPFGEMSLEYLLFLLNTGALADLIEDLQDSADPNQLDFEELLCNPFSTTDIDPFAVTSDDTFEGTPTAVQFCPEGDGYKLEGMTILEGSEPYAVSVSDTTADFRIAFVSFPAVETPLVLTNAQNGLLHDLTLGNTTVLTDSDVELFNITADHLLITGGTTTISNSHFQNITVLDGELTLEDSSIAHTLDATDATVTLRTVSWDGLSTPLLQNGGSVEISGLIIQEPQDLPCFQGNGELRLTVSTSDCENGLASWTNGRIEATDSALEFLSGAAFNVTDTQLLISGGSIEGGSQVADLVGGSLLIDETLLFGQGANLARLTGDTEVELADVVVQQGPTALFNLTANGGPGTPFVLTNNDFRQTDDVFGTSAGATWNHVFILNGPFSAAETNVIGGPASGGNAWGGAQVADVTNDGVAEEAYSPPGIDAADQFPLVDPNTAPFVTYAAAPDIANFTLPITPSTEVTFTAVGVDAESPQLTYAWEHDGQVHLGDQFTNYFEEGIHTILLTGMDEQFATHEQTITVHSVPEDNAPELMSVQFSPDCVTYGELPLVVNQGSEGCFRAEYVDADGAGLETWNDFWYLGFDSTEESYRLMGSEENILQQGFVAPGAPDDALPFLRTPDAAWALVDGTVYAVFGCDGTIDVGDVRVYPGNGTKVLASHPDLGLPYTSQCNDLLPVHLSSDSVYVDADGDGTMDLLLGENGPVPAGSHGALLPYDVEIGVADRDGAVRLNWDIVNGGPRIAGTGEVIDMEFLNAGIADINVFLADGGDNGAATLYRYTVNVQSDAPAVVRFAASDVFDRDGNTITVVRDTPFSLQDTSLAAPGSSIASVAWDCPACDNASAGTDDFTATLSTPGTHQIQQTVATSNGAVATGAITVEVILQAPTATLDVSPLTFYAGDAVRLSSESSVDLGDAIAATNPFLQVGYNLSGQPESFTLLNLPPASVGSEDVVFGGLQATYLPGHVERNALDQGADTTATGFCFIDEDLDGEWLYPEPLYAGNCGTSPLGLYRLSYAGLPAGEVTVFDADSARTGLQPIQVRVQWFPSESDGTLVVLKDLLVSATDVQVYPVMEPVAADDNRVGLVGTPVDLRQGLGATTPFLVDLDGDELITEGDLRLSAFAYYAENQASVPTELQGLSWAGPAPDACMHTQTGLWFLGDCESSSGTHRLQSEGIIGNGKFGDLVLDHAFDGGLPLVPAGTIGIANGAVVLDADEDGQVSPGDVRLSTTDALGAVGGDRVPVPTSGDLGTNVDVQFSCASGCEFDSFPNNVIGNDLTETVTFSSSGTKILRMLVTDEDGTQVEITRELIVKNRPPTPIILPPTGPVYSTEAYNFNGFLSFDEDGDPAGLDLRYKWSFGDGSSVVSGAIVPHKFPAPGDYLVTLTVRDGDDVEPLEAEAQQWITVANRDPQPDFTTSPANIKTLSTLVLDATASLDPDGSIVSYNWGIYQAGAPAKELQGKTQQVQFARPGAVTISLATVDNLGGFATISKTINVANQLPTAKLTVDANARLPPAIFQFSAAGSKDPEGTALSYSFDFDDGTTVVGPAASVSHEFQQRGQFDVTLTVTDADGGQATEQVTVTVLNQPPIGIAQGPLVGDVNQALTFTAHGSDSDGDAISFAWDFAGSKFSADGTGDTFTVTPTKWGSYVLTLTTTDEAGAATAKTYTVKIASEAPTATLEATATSVNIGEEITFTGSGSDTDGNITGHFFDLGDGTTRFGNTATHSYNMPGTYTVRYTATDDSQRSGAATAIVEVLNPAPVINSVGASQTEINVGDLILFRVDATDVGGDSLSYTWDFGDGVVVNGRTPTHVYRLPGLFNAEVTVEDSFGKSATGTIEIEVVKLDTVVNDDDVIDTNEETGVDRVNEETPPFAPMLGLLLIAIMAWRRR